MTVPLTIYNVNKFCFQRCVYGVQVCQELRGEGISRQYNMYLYTLLYHSLTITLNTFCILLKSYMTVSHWTKLSVSSKGQHVLTEVEYLHT